MDIHYGLRDDLNVDNRIGATYGKAYCGVVGGVKRHEFAVLGPSVNLAARLMANKGNPGILVDETVRRLVDAKINFKALRPVKAKGYAREVPIFVPLEKISSANRKFIGRKQEIQQILDHAVATMRNIDPDDSNSKRNKNNGKISFITGGSGLGKTLAANQVCKRIQATARSMDK